MILRLWRVQFRDTFPFPYKYPVTVIVVLMMMPYDATSKIIMELIKPGPLIWAPVSKLWRLVRYLEFSR
jgi:hypothetical protein